MRCLSVNRPLIYDLSTAAEMGDSNLSCLAVSQSLFKWLSPLHTFILSMWEERRGRLMNKLVNGFGQVGSIDSRGQV